MTQKLRIKVPDAPPDLFRKLKKQIQRDRESFNMHCWHADSEGNYPDTAAELKCTTVHCMAGWINVLTPDGLKLENKLRKRFAGYSDYGGELPEYADAADNETAATALLILDKAGWSEEINHGHFHTGSRAALRLINRLAKLEADRAHRAKRAQRAQRQVA